MRADAPEPAPDEGIDMKPSNVKSLSRLRTAASPGMLARLGATCAAIFVSAALGSGPARAQTTTQGKVAIDLQRVIAAPLTPLLNWATDLLGQRYVKALIVANSTDPSLAALRAAVLANGGSVYYRFVSVPALSVMLPASKVSVIAARSDVQSISPNRLALRMGSTLEYTTGAIAPGVRTYGSSLLGGASYSGLDGAGVGIAVLDSGIAWSHLNMKGPGGMSSRVVRAVDMQKIGDGTKSGLRDWTPGLDLSSLLALVSSALSNLESAINITGLLRTDYYGHGTHVASVAAGRGFYQTHDSTGVAPNANLFDVKVLDANGVGQLSDVLEGIVLQVTDVLEAMQADSGLALKELRVDGGAAANDMLMQLQADLLGVQVVRPANAEATALGNVAMQMLATGAASSLAEVRAIIDHSFPTEVFAPADTARWGEQVERFHQYSEMTYA